MPTTQEQNKELTWEQLVKKHTIETSSKFTVDVRGICDEYAAIKVLKHLEKAKNIIEIKLYEKIMSGYTVNQADTINYFNQYIETLKTE